MLYSTTISLTTGNHHLPSTAKCDKGLSPVNLLQVYKMKAIPLAAPEEAPPAPLSVFQLKVVHLAYYLMGSRHAMHSSILPRPTLIFPCQCFPVRFSHPRGNIESVRCHLQSTINCSTAPFFSLVVGRCSYKGRLKWKECGILGSMFTAEKEKSAVEKNTFY